MLPLYCILYGGLGVFFFFKVKALGVYVGGHFGSDPVQNQAVPEYKKVWKIPTGDCPGYANVCYMQFYMM